MNDLPPSRPAILIVDDRPENLFAMKLVLRDSNVEMLCASTGREALEIAFSRRDIAVVVLDVQMPQMDGFEVAEALRGDTRTTTLPIIFLTAGEHDAKTMFRGYDCGAVDVLSKPITDNILISKIRVFVELATRQNRLEQVLEFLEESKLELEKSNSALHDFAHAAAHDLQSPLRHIGFHAEIINADFGTELPAGAVIELHGITKTVKRMQGLLDGLLEYATLGGASPRLVPVSLKDVLRAVLYEATDRIKQSAASVEFEELPEVLGDLTLLHQVFQNLISNALKYHRPGRPPVIDIRAEILDDGKACSIRVHDDGIGFDSERTEEMFTPFRRLVGKSEFEGAGIGLASVKRALDLMGGRLSAVGEEGVGATFLVTLRLPECGQKAA